MRSLFFWNLLHSAPFITTIRARWLFHCKVVVWWRYNFYMPLYDLFYHIIGKCKLWRHTSPQELPTFSPIKSRHITVNSIINILHCRWRVISDQVHAFSLYCLNYHQWRGIRTCTNEWRHQMTSHGSTEWQKKGFVSAFAFIASCCLYLTTRACICEHLHTIHILKRVNKIWGHNFKGLTFT